MVVLINAYHYAWALGNSTYACPDLKIAWKNKVTSATVAFVISDPSNPKKIWSQITACYSDMKMYVKAGGFLIISCGGANGPYLEENMTENEQFFALDCLIQETRVMYLDFDVEGNQPRNTLGNQQRANVIKKLQNKYLLLKISYTISVLHVSQWQHAIQGPELALLTGAIQTGVKIDRVNAMVMDTSYDLSGNWGGTTIGIIEGMKTQLKTLFPKKSDAQLYKSIGITNMIGLNDNATIFTLQDAKVVIDYAKLRQIGMVSYWALQRDQTKQGGLAISSMLQQRDFAFWNILTGGKGPLPQPRIKSWKIGTSYMVGDQIIYDGRLYKCQISNTAVFTWNPSNTPALWADLDNLVRNIKDIQVNLPQSLKPRKMINMHVKVDFDKNGKPSLTLLSTQSVY